MNLNHLKATLQRMLTADGTLPMPQIFKKLEGGTTFGDLQGLSPESLESLYGIAHHLYQINKYAEAEAAFRLLCFYNHYEYKYWFGLGAVLQVEKKYEEALGVYGFALITNFKDPMVRMHIAECLLSMGAKDKAALMLRDVVEYAGDSKPLREKAKGLIEILKIAQ